MGSTPLGRICWYELMTTGPEDAVRFYGEVVGWGSAVWDGGEKPYTMWMNGEQPIGGVMELPPEAVAQGAPPHWLMYVSTPDAADTAARAERLSADILAQMDIPEVGSIAVIRDPQGAVFAAYQPAGDTPGHDGPPAVGEFSWHELATSDWEAAWSFYSQLFGWEETDQMEMGDMGIYHMFGRGAHPLGGMFSRPPEMPVSAWLLYAKVPDVAAAVERTNALGGQVVNGPMEVPGGDMIAQCVDPQGAMFAVHAGGAG